MKTSALGFVLVGAMITLLAALSLAGVVFVLHPFVTLHPGPYFVIADFFAFLLLYGVLSGLAVQLLRRVRPLQTGEYSMDSPNFSYWNLLVMLCDLGRGALLPFTPMPCDRSWRNSTAKIRQQRGTERHAVRPLHGSVG